jgi:hypothetical protein
VGLKFQVALMPTFSNDELRRFEKRWTSPSSDDSLNDADPRPLSSLRTVKGRSRMSDLGPGTKILRTVTMSALGQKETADCRLLMFAIPPKADIGERDDDVR